VLCLAWAVCFICCQGPWLCFFSLLMVWWHGYTILLDYRHFNILLNRNMKVWWFMNWGWHNKIFLLQWILLPIQVSPSYLIRSCVWKAYQRWFWSQGNGGCFLSLTMVDLTNRACLLYAHIAFRGSFSFLEIFFTWLQPSYYYMSCWISWKWTVFW
jgi:hypothetical protein